MNVGDRLSYSVLLLPVAQERWQQALPMHPTWPVSVQ
jgi:hypothetical protein